ncbi:MAG TPA: FAD-dependent oxidoreductase [Candidatus Limnocylindria bacterium]|nr:FAD-dependent oxidoreductase [Candidatus Limnocylindria bacterium]
MATPSHGTTNRTRPTIVVVDDDPPVLRAIERDLRGRYGDDYRIVAATGGDEALEATRELTVRGTPIALFVVDQRMPRMTGIELLLATLELQPDAKRVLLTAYADTEVAIRAINEVRLDQYILKPWDPPEERLFPIVDDLLADWTATFRPAFEGLRLIAGRWAPRGHAIRDFLTRNGIPYAWLDPETDDEGRRLAATQEATDPAVPLVLLPDGTALVDPATRELAERVGLSMRPSRPFYDLVIVGGGPAGLAAAVYGASEGLKTVLVEREAPGGQAGTTSRIENYLGFPAGLSGGDLARRALTQARRLGAEILSPAEVRAVRREDPYRILVTDEGEISCQAAIVATGVSYRTLDLPDAERLAGAGIYYGAATTEAVLYRGMEVAVVGGGNSAGQAVTYLARFADRVHLVIRTSDLSGMSQYLVEQIEALDNVALHASSAVTGVQGAAHLEGITVTTHETSTELPAAALFVFIGQQPRTDWLADAVVRDAPGFVLTGAETRTDGRPPAGWTPRREPFLLETSMPGVFAAGDVRHRSVKRIASAVGDGAMAVQFVHQYLAGL